MEEAKNRFVAKWRGVYPREVFPLHDLLRALLNQNPPIIDVSKIADARNLITGEHFRSDLDKSFFDTLEGHSSAKHHSLDSLLASLFQSVCSFCDMQIDMEPHPAVDMKPASDMRELCGQIWHY